MMWDTLGGLLCYGQSHLEYLASVLAGFAGAGAPISEGCTLIRELTSSATGHWEERCTLGIDA